MKKIFFIIILILTTTYSNANSNKEAPQIESINEIFRTIKQKQIEEKDIKNELIIAKRRLQNLALKSKTNQNHIRNYQLFYNLGIINYHLEDYGNAVLWLRKAEILNPEEKTIQNKIDAIYKKTDNPHTPITMPISFLLAHHIKLGMSAKIIFFLLFCSLFTIPATIWTIRKKKKIAYIYASINLITLSYVLIVILTQFIATQDTTIAVSISPQTITYKKPGINQEKSSSIPIKPGTEFYIINKEKNWYKIRFKDENISWVQSKDIAIINSK